MLRTLVEAAMQADVYKRQVLAAAYGHAALDAASQRIVDHVPHGGRVQNRRAAARFDRFKAQRNRLKSEPVSYTHLLLPVVQEKNEVSLCGFATCISGGTFVARVAFG